ncbi:MAG: hypothetical protein VKK59_04155, partial [Vampirovibrionales bacterium]|nr:hypothetical protein [Vampirovibrionales bacterium]
GGQQNGSLKTAMDLVTFSGLNVSGDPSEIAQVTVTRLKDPKGRAFDHIVAMDASGKLLGATDLSA